METISNLEAYFLPSVFFTIAKPTCKQLLLHLIKNKK